MRRLLLLTCFLLVGGCATMPPAPPRQPDPPVQSAPPPPVRIPQTAPAELPQKTVDRDQLREELVRFMNEAGGTPEEKLTRFVGKVYRQDEVPWLKADLDGNGENEFILARGVTDDGRRPGQGASLFVIYKKDGAWAADRSDPMDERMEFELMAPHLHAVADLAGSGPPQIVWFRPEMIATGPQPFFVFVTAWAPGQFTHLAGKIALSNFRLSLDGRDLVLTGTSRNNTYLPVMERTDRYRYADGAFRLVDRRFAEHPQDGYARLWDGLVAEATRHAKEAETAYREVLDSSMPAHSGTIFGYKMAPRQLTEADVQRFSEALRAFARFRLGALLIQEGRGEEARVVWEAGGGAYSSLFEAVLQQKDRCKAAENWASGNPEFLGALNLGVGTSPWTPEQICSHIDIDDHGFWEP